METVGIICEYNPLHRGHEKQIRHIRQQLPDARVVCLMSGNFVQRGAPAIVDKSLRAQAAVLAGADLVLELPTNYALSSAEGFAAGGVSILGSFCTRLCFGTETGEAQGLMATADALLRPEFSEALRVGLDQGLSFPAARAAALELLGADSTLVRSPNDILAVEYCKAIRSQGCAMLPFPIHRQGSYHAEAADEENPSATAVRRLMLQKDNWRYCVSGSAQGIFQDARLHTVEAGERAVLAGLRTMTDAEFEALPYGSEGLWRKLMHNSRRYATLEEILTATKSKRYTRTRLDRMVMCAFLGITEEILRSRPPYIRVLAFNDSGRAVLKQARQTGEFLNAGQAVVDPWWEMEKRWGDLYGLFAVGDPEAPGAEEQRRIFYHP